VRFAIDSPEVEAEARLMLRETIEASGWYPGLQDDEREAVVKREVERNWRLMAEEARERLEKGRR